MKKIFIIGSVILILFSIAVYLAKPGIVKTGTDTEKVNPHRIDELDTDALCHQIDEQEAKYNEDCRQLLSAFLADLEKNVASDFDKAEFAVPSVVNDLSGFKVCVKLCYKVAKDRMMESHDFTDAFIDTMDVPIIRPCVHANMVASDMLQTLQLRLKERLSRHVTDLAVICANDCSDWKLPTQSFENLQICLGKFAELVSNTDFEKTAGIIGIAIEAYFIRETCGYMVKLFAKPAAKICCSLGISGISAGADGPLPFGDVVGAVLSIGGFAWTAWDVYDITCVMPKKLNSELRKGIASAKSTLLEESCVQANELALFYRQSADKINRELKAQLK